VSSNGLSITDSALLISVVSYAFVLLAGYRIMLLLFGELEAFGALAAVGPVRTPARLSDSAFSDPPGLAILLTAFWLLARYAKEPEKRARLAFMAGWAAGIGVATRYALASLVVIGALLYSFARPTGSATPCSFSYPPASSHSGRVAQPQHPAWLGVAPLPALEIQPLEECPRLQWRLP